ncbi:MAG: 30S ribosomal protein S6 [Candidatus Omnitrophica bacterium]|nr:30S ribosomal protein S6 [Candidatus Omnitrophota bacterium]MDD5610096.1 30S ribosomal protein S6 [Candidatus Omnitrophota bacterium]
MKKYEAMFMVKPDLGEAETKNVFQQINDAITKNSGEIVTSGLWSEKKPLYFTIKKYREAIYYLVEFNLDPLVITKIKSQYRMNEDILRSLILKKE